MAFPPNHLIHKPLTTKIMALQPLRFDKKMVKIMDKDEDLYWSDKERIKRAEEIRRKNKKRR